MPPTAVLTTATRDTRDRGMSRTVADAMITDVKLSRPDVTVGELRDLFRDEHVHTAVIVERGVLLSVVDRIDVEVGADDDLAVGLGYGHARTIPPEAELEHARQSLLVSGRRRLAVVGPEGEFRGLLCLKRSRAGFCSDRDVRARAQAAAPVTSGEPGESWPRPARRGGRPGSPGAPRGRTSGPG